MIFQRKNKDVAKARSPRKSEGGTQKKVFSYYQNRDTDETERVNKRKPASSVLAHLPGILAATVILLSCIYSVTLTTEPKIVIVNEQNNSALKPFLRAKNVYSSSVGSRLSASILNRNKITLDTNKLQQQLQEEFPELTDVSIVLPIISRRPTVYLRVAESALLLTSNQKTYVIDEKGRAIIGIENIKSDNTAQLLKVDDDAGLDLNPGDQALPKAHVEFIKNVVEQLSSKGVRVSRMQLPASANELHVYLEKQPYYIKFTMTNDPAKQAGTYLALKKAISAKKITPKKYIDVRVEERAYYL